MEEKESEGGGRVASSEEAGWWVVWCFLLFSPRMYDSSSESLFISRVVTDGVACGSGVVV